jgi:hypothetical protein
MEDKGEISFCERTDFEKIVFQKTMGISLLSKI